MANVPVTLIPSIVHGAQPLPVVSDKAKGAGYYGAKEAFHTVQFTLENAFIGAIKIQATLADNPTEIDWFDVQDASLDTEFIPALDGATTVNFIGNFVWVRAVVTRFDTGSINRVLYTHN